MLKEIPFMKQIRFKNILPHLAAVLIFLAVAVIYCKPALQGKVITQHDTQGWRGMAQQSFEFKEKHGHFPLWTNSMFSGMPAYQIAMDARTNVSVGYAHYIFTLGLPKPVNFFFLAAICFYFLCVVAGANPWVSIFGGLAYAYSTFNPIITAVGHDTQMISIGYAPAVLAGLLLLFQKKYWIGFAVTALFSVMLIMQSHLQIVYYTLLMAAIMTIAFLIKSYREKQLAQGFKAALLGLAGGIIGLACCAVSMMPTYEYAKESMRGGRSELTLGDKDVKTKGGLDKDYAFRYSLGFGETFTFLIPGLYGGSNGGNEYDENSEFVNQFSQLGVPAAQAVQYENGYSYWGDQPLTSGPVYLGAIVCLLFIFGVVYLKGWQKGWLIAASIVGVLLAYGANLKGFNYFLFDYLPFYNKFRAPTMSLVIPQLCFPLLGVLAVHRLITAGDLQSELLKKLKLTAIITGAILLLMAAFYFTASFSGTADNGLKENIQQNIMGQVPPGQQAPPQMVQQAESLSSGIISALRNDRKGLMGGDLLRTVILVALALLALYFFIKKKISTTLLTVTLIVLSTYDLLGIATRYLNEGKYVEETDFESVFIPTEADRQILADPDHDHIRVFNQTVDVFNDATTSYHHNSVGGYHPAKLDLYNDIITYQLSKGNMGVFNMLNTKYFISPNPQTGKPIAQLNPDAFGNAWLVNGVKFVADPDAEMLALDNTNLRDTAIVEEKYKQLIPQSPVTDSAASIRLGAYENDRITYKFHSSQPQVAVFSEVYYPRGWHAFIDGKEASYFRTNYVLRGMYVPAGDHEIEFRFEPQSFATGRTITIIANILVMLLVIMAIIMWFRHRNEKTV